MTSLVTDFQTAPAQNDAGVLAPPTLTNLPVTDPSRPSSPSDKEKSEGKLAEASLAVRDAEEEHHQLGGDGRLPTEEEKKTLRLVSGHVPWTAFVICLVEFAERASYYGCSGVFYNFIQQPLPAGGNGAGAPPKGSQLTAGALGMGLQPATALTTLFTFLAYTIPILGAIVSDTKWGRFKTIAYGTAAGFVGHVILIIAAIPTVLAKGDGLAPFLIGLIVLAFASGFIKPSVAPLLADQSPVHRQEIKTLPSGEVVIVDPGQTVQSMMMNFYWAINVGSLLQLATTYCEKDVGFWLAYLVPGIIYMLVPVALALVYKKLTLLPPQGSVVLDACRVSGIAIKKRSWDAAKPSVIEATVAEEKRPKHYSQWDDAFIGELKVTLKASKLFLFFVVFQIADAGLNSILTSMAASMTTNGAPNDLLLNFNSITIIVVVPLMNYGIYPLLRRWNINFSPIKRITFGFVLAGLGMVASAILQWQVYETSPCGYYASDCSDGRVSPISVWAQIPLFVLPAAGEVFANVTSYELAYTLAPQRMKGLVFAIVLFMSALSSAIVEIISPSMVDPKLVWPFVGIGVATFISAACIYFFFSDLDNAVVAVEREIEGIISPEQRRREQAELLEKEHREV